MAAVHQALLAVYAAYYPGGTPVAGTLSQTDRSGFVVLNSALLAATDGLAAWGVAVDLSNKKVWFYNPTLERWNAAAIGSQDPVSGTGGYTYTTTGALFPMLSLFGTASGRINGGTANFANAGAPSGFTAWDTAAGSTLAFDSGNKGANITLSGGLASNTTAAWNSIKGTSSLSSGKVYFEIMPAGFDGSNGFICGMGNTTASLTSYAGSDGNSFGVQTQGSGYGVAGGADSFLSPAATSWKTGRGTAGRTSGKGYFEVGLTAGSDLSHLMLGVADSSATLTNYVGSDVHGYGLQPGSGSGSVYHNGGSTTNLYGTATVGQTVGVALDITNSKLWFWNSASGNWNNAAIGSQDPANNTGGISISGLTGSIFPALSFFDHAAATTLTFNLGGSAFVGSVPSGFSSW